ncbi:GapR family DNA-binding domain-containing protein [Caldovatus aquaticus]|uniref:DUF2312 domain-containing protein n=1 Tax=Caldovatus aquaticus TaxID=2865671 RepID=A0ABS7F026_9PROT|nr:GapR family DNA-binding domain-containing protein [Caldovatus aquaticus]MBW8268312.1 DUF2312 domain-containing protein [Caldovatus aquaticus]
MESEILPPSGGKGTLVPVGGSVPAVAGAERKRGRKKAEAGAPPISNRETMAKGYVERLARLLAEKQELAIQIAEVKAEAKSAGFSPKAIAMVAARQLETAEERDRREAVEMEADQIMAALGMLADTPLGQAATERAAN